MSDEVQRDLGRHDAQIEHLEHRMALVEKKLDRIITLLSEAKGGWRALMLVGGIAGAIGAAATKLIMAFGWVPK